MLRKSQKKLTKLVHCRLIAGSVAVTSDSATFTSAVGQPERAITVVFGVVSLKALSDPRQLLRQLPHVSTSPIG